MRINERWTASRDECETRHPPLSIVGQRVRVARGHSVLSRLSIRAEYNYVLQVEAAQRFGSTIARAGYYSYFNATMGFTREARRAGR